MDTRSPQREQEALIEGERAGQLSLGAGLNPYEIGTREYAEWERGRSSAEARRASEYVRQARAAALCPYTPGCDCAGRGLCLDAA